MWVIWSHGRRWSTATQTACYQRRRLHRPTRRFSHRGSRPISKPQKDVISYTTRRLTLRVSFITLMAKPSLRFVLPNISEISISYFFGPIFHFWEFSWIPISWKWMFCEFKVFSSFLLIMISRVLINDQYLFVRFTVWIMVLIYFD